MNVAEALGISCQHVGMRLEQHQRLEQEVVKVESVVLAQHPLVAAVYVRNRLRMRDAGNLGRILVGRIRVVLRI